MSLLIENQLKDQLTKLKEEFGISGIKAEFEAEGEFYGEERLEQVFKKNSNLPADELCRKIREDLFGFCGTNQQKDDITIVAIKASTSRD